MTNAALTVLTKGFFPLWSSEKLERLLEACESDNAFVTQGSTTTPPPLMCVADWKLEACCPVCYCSVDDPTDCTVGEAEEAFAKACYEADQLVGEPAACRWLLNWIDDEPRNVVLSELAVAIKDELASRVVSSTK